MFVGSILKNLVKHRFFALFAIFSAWSIDVLLVQRTLQGWWFEDDPGMYATAAKVEHFYDFFVKKSFLNANEIIPMQYLSMWIDNAISSRSPFVGYMHSSLSVLVASFLLYFLLEQLSVPKSLSVVTTCIWIYLPTTLATHELIAARGYIEGLCFAMIAILLSFRLESQTGNKRRLTLGMIIISCGLSFLSKEFYPTALPVFLFLFAVRHKLWDICIALLSVCCAYAAYRLWATGMSFEYRRVPHLHGIKILKGYWRVAFMFLGSDWSYWALGAVSFGFLSDLLRKRKLIPYWICWFLVLGSALATIYAVLSPVSLQSKMFGTWYRTPFVLNTIFLIGSVVLLRWKAHPILLAAFLLFVGLGLKDGTPSLVSNWKIMKSEDEVVGKFLLAHPGYYILDRNPASWFLPDLIKLYEAAPPQNILRYSDERAQKICREQGKVWMKQGGVMIEAACPL